MKNIILFSVFVVLFACCQQQKYVITQEDSATKSSTTVMLSDSTTNTITNIENKTSIHKSKLSKNDSLLESLQQQYSEDYDSYQRAVRKLVLQQKKNSILKNSCLEEFYLQGFAKTTKDSIEVHLPFNLHTFDCGAPDCYTTEVNFCLAKENPIIFPDALPFREEQWGCMEKYQFNDFSKYTTKIDKYRF